MKVVVRNKESSLHSEPIRPKFQLVKKEEKKKPDVPTRHTHWKPPTQAEQIRYAQDTEYRSHGKKRIQFIVLEADWNRFLDRNNLVGSGKPNKWFEKIIKEYGVDPYNDSALQQSPYLFGQKGEKS